MHAQWFLITALGLAACAPAIPTGGARAFEQPSVTLAGDAAERLLRPCNWPAPPADSTWVPTAVDVARAERRIAAAATAQSWLRPGWGPEWPLAEYRGQYTGFWSHERRYVYGTLVHRTLQDDEQARFATEPARWCDADGMLFGAIYDVDADSVVALYGRRGRVEPRPAAS